MFGKFFFLFSDSLNSFLNFRIVIETLEEFTAKRALKVITVIPTTLVFHVHALKQTRTSLAAATSLERTLLATAKKVTPAIFAISALKDSSVIQNILTVSVRVAIAIMRESFQTSAMS